MKLSSIAINIIFITCLAYLTVTAFYQGALSRFSDPVERSAIQTQLDEIQNKKNKTLSEYDAILSRNLFKTGEARQKPAQPSEPQTDITQLKETDLKLKLWGTVTGSKSGSAYAVIEETVKRKQDLFRVGDTVQGAIIKEILRERVVLTVNGKDEVLGMEKAISDQKQVASSKTVEPQQPPPPPGLSAPTPLETAPAADAESTNRQISVQRASINEAINNINDLMKQAKIRPHFKNGKPDGLILSRVQSDSIFTQLGLKSGDIITGVNGTPIESVDDALNFYNNLKTASNVSLQIRRRGRDENVDYSVE